MHTGTFAATAADFPQMPAPLPIPKPSWAADINTPDGLCNALRGKGVVTSMTVNGRSSLPQETSMSVNTLTFTFEGTPYSVAFYVRRSQCGTARKARWFARDVVAGKHDKAATS